jgi:hypothetical protein
MIKDDQQFQVTLKRIAWIQQQLAELRNPERNLTNYRASAAGLLKGLTATQEG